MESIVVKKSFSQALKLIRAASSQDVMLVNETSPCMVRYLGKDNLFRTFVLTEVENELEIKATKSDDKAPVLQQFSDFLDERTDAEKEAEQKEQLRLQRQQESNKKEAEAFRLKQEAKRESELGEPKPSKPVAKKKASKKSSVKKTKTAKKKTTKKKKTAKKKVSKKK